MTTPTTVNVRLQLRADTAANWTAANPILLANEVGLETDTKKLKVGNGSTAWNSLAYFPSIVSGGTVLGNLEIGSTGTLTFEGSTADGFETTLAVTNPTADRTITLPNQSGTVVVSGNASIVDADIAANAEIAVSKLADGAARQLLQTDAAGTGVEWTSNVDIPGTLDVTGAATFDGAVTVAGDLTVNGTTTTISTQNLLVEDKNIIIGDVATPTDTTADGGGITLKGATDKTINWVDSTDAWTSSERFSVPLGSAASPSLTFTGDENTGLYSPGADQVAISTGGSPRVTVTSTGVGIGTTSPVATLHSRVDNAGSGSTPLLIQNRSVSANTAVGISFAPNTSDAADRSAIIYGVNSSGGSGNATDLAFHTNANGGSPNEKARIDSSGRLLVGTSSSRNYTSLGNPQLQIEGIAYAQSSIGLTNNQNVADGSYILFNKTRGTSVGSNTIVQADDSLGAIWFQGTDGSASVLSSTIACVVEGTPAANKIASRLVFSTTADGASSPTERMRIGNSGTTRLFTSNYGLLLGNSQSAGTTYTALEIYAGSTSTSSLGTLTLQIYNNGNVQNTNNSYAGISDIKLKENIVDANSQWSDIKALQVRNYNFKKGQAHTQIGLIAQEVEQVSPGLVSESPDRDEDGNDLGTVTKSVNYSVLYMKAVKALQEAMERIEQLEQRLAAAGI